MSILKNTYRLIFTLMCYVMLLGSGGCTTDDTPASEDGDLVNFEISTRSIVGSTVNGVSISTIRIIAAEVGSNIVAYNKTTSNGGLTDSGPTTNIGKFITRLKPGQYNIYVIANETPAMSATLQNIVLSSEMNAIKVENSFTEPNLVLYSVTKVKVKAATTNPTETEGLVQIDGQSSWISTLPLNPERAAVKISLAVKKNTTTPGDTFTITKAEVVHLPTYGYLIPQSYDSQVYQTKTIYDNATGATFTTNNSVTATPIGTDIVVPEYLLTTPSDVNLAAVLRIYATYNGSAVIYKIPISQIWPNPTNYNLYRDHIYKMTVTITQAGVSDYNPYVEYTISDWTDALGEELNIGGSIGFTGAWASGTTAIDTKTVGVYNNGYVEYQFTLAQPTGATWVASLTNGLEFAFDNTGGGVSSGIARMAPYTIRVKPLNSVTTTGVATKFYITVNNNAHYVELDLISSQPSIRYEVKQIPQ